MVYHFSYIYATYFYTLKVLASILKFEFIFHIASHSSHRLFKQIVRNSRDIASSKSKKLRAS